MSLWKARAQNAMTVRSSMAVIAGTLLMTLATFAVLQATGAFEYLILTATSTTASMLIGIGVRPSLLGDRYLARDWPNAIFVGVGGVVLGLEVVLVSVLIPNTTSALYSVATLAAASMTLWGNYGLNAIRVQLPIEQRSPEERVLTA